MSLEPKDFLRHTESSMTGTRLPFYHLPVHEAGNRFYRASNDKGSCIVYGEHDWFRRFIVLPIDINYYYGPKIPVLSSRLTSSFWYNPDTLLVSKVEFRRGNVLSFPLSADEVVRCVVNNDTGIITSIQVSPEQLQFYCPDLYLSAKENDVSELDQPVFGYDDLMSLIDHPPKLLRPPKPKI